MLLHQELKRQRRAAFTLMEMLIVVAIIVLLAGIGVVSYFALFDSAKVDVARTQIKSLTTACDAYYLKNKSYPGQLSDMLQKDPNGNRPLIEDPSHSKTRGERPINTTPREPKTRVATPTSGRRARQHRNRQLAKAKIIAVRP